MGHDNDVPHFDRRGHWQRQEGVRQTTQRSRGRKKGVTMEDVKMERDTSVLVNFFLVGGVLTVVLGVTGLVSNKGNPNPKRNV